MPRETETLVCGALRDSTFSTAIELPWEPGHVIASESLGPFWAKGHRFCHPLSPPPSKLSSVT